MKTLSKWAARVGLIALILLPGAIGSHYMFGVPLGKALLRSCMAALGAAAAVVMAVFFVLVDFAFPKEP